MYASKWCHNKKHLGLLVLRVAVGLVLFLHGVDKLSNMTGTIGFFSQLGLGAGTAWLVTLVETAGGLALILGIGTQVAAMIIAVQFVIIIVWLKSGKPFDSYNLDFIILAATLALGATGGGKYSFGKKCVGCKACDCGCHGDKARCAEGKCDDCKCS